MRHSGAVWCDEHGRWECRHNSKRSQERCHGAAVRGTDTCTDHGGKPTEVLKAQGEANLLAWSTLLAGDARPLDLGRTVMDQLRVAVMRAELYGGLLRDQVVVERSGGLVGSSEEVRGLVRVEAAERDRVVRFVKVAHDMGIDERQIELQQEQAQLVTGAFMAALQVVSSLLPADRDLMVRTFLAGLGRGPEVLEGQAS